jgi:phage terminase large subunit-like protein
MRAGPKAAVSNRGLVERDLPAEGGARVSAWVEQFIRLPKGTGAKQPLLLRPWQMALVSSVFDAPRPRLAMWSLPRGQGKSSVCAALALYGLHGDSEEGASVVVVASDERQARIVFNTAVRMTELSKPLSQRCQMFQDRIYVPRTGSTLQVLPADPHRLEGLDPSMAIIDEIGVVSRPTYEVLALATGKRESSLILAIGTPSPMGQESVMWSLRDYALTHPEDTSLSFTEYAAPAGCELDDESAWAIANPALGDFLHMDSMHALLPPKTRESTYRRARLGQWTDQAEDSWMESGLWNACADKRPISDGAEVVLAFDGSFNRDTTALIAATVSSTPHLDVAGFWAAPQSDPDWRVDVLAVEDAIRVACRRWRVREVTADPFRWNRSLQVLAAERVAVVSEFPQSASRMSPATAGLHEAVVDRLVTHSGNVDLAAHVAHCHVREDARGTRLTKEAKGSTRKIDLAVAAVMAHSRAVFYGRKAATPRKARSFQ